MEDLVIDRTRGMGRAFVIRWLEEHPAVGRTLRERNVRVVVVEPKHGALFPNTQAAIDTAEVPDDVRAMFVALTNLSAIVETGAFELRNQGQSLMKMRGAFVGYIAIGEGGVVFFDERGRMQVPDAEMILQTLDSCL